MTEQNKLEQYGRRLKQLKKILEYQSVQRTAHVLIRGRYFTTV